MKGCLAGIILYNPDIDRLKKNINAIIDQVEWLVLVDNGSSNIDCVQEIVPLEKTILVINQANEGIAKALNQIFDVAIKKNMEWVYTLDQDSISDDHIISKYNKYLSKEIGILCPKVIDINAKETYIPQEGIQRIFNSDEVITSGSLTQVEMWKRINGFDERLFIDYVDTDFQERVLRSNGAIVRVLETYILHEVGKLEVYKIGRLKIYCSNHNSTRRYYAVRNRLYFRRKYFGYSAYIKERIRLFLGDVKIMLFEIDKLEKVKASLRGCRDYRKLLG